MAGKGRPPSFAHETNGQDLDMLRPIIPYKSFLIFNMIYRFTDFTSLIKSSTVFLKSLIINIENSLRSQLPTEKLKFLLMERRS